MSSSSEHGNEKPGDGPSRRESATGGDGRDGGEAAQPISDSQLRTVIQQAAARGPRPPHATQAAKQPRSGRLTMRRAQALRRIPVDRASRPQMLLAAVAFLLHWAATIAASILYEHFRPTTTEPAQFATLLISSLSVFTAAMVAFIELAKFTRAGRSVTIGLGFINVLIFAAVAIYARHWLIVLAQFVFALGLLALLAGRTLNEKQAERSGGSRKPVAESSRRSLVVQIPWGWVCAGLLLIASAWTLLLWPAATYAQKRTVSEETFAAAQAAHDADRWNEEIADKARQGREASRWLTEAAAYVGETAARRATFQRRWGYLEALLGNPEPGLALIDEAQRREPSTKGYRMRAEVYCMLHDLPFMPSLTEEEVEALDPPPGHYVPERRDRTVRGYDPEAEWHHDIFD